MLIGSSLVPAILVLFGASSISLPDARDDSDKDETVSLSVKDYGVEVQVPSQWKLVAKADETMVFGFTIPTEAAQDEAGVKCEIGPAPETLDEYRERIDRRAERQRRPGISLKRNALVKTEMGERLETEWNY